MKKYFTRTSCPVDVPIVTAARNPSSIGEEPVPYEVTTIRSSATSMLVSHTEQGTITFTNLLQGHKTVVPVYCTSKPETDCTHGKEEIPLSQRVWHFSIGKMLHICSLSKESQVHRRTTRHHTFNYPHTP